MNLLKDLDADVMLLGVVVLVAVGYVLSLGCYLIFKLVTRR